MENVDRKEIGEWLNKFPEVMWDRFSVGETGAFVSVFGWIEREQDSYKDYVELCFWENKPDGISTSSAKYSKEFADRLDFGHSDCKRVERWFKNVTNVARLK